MQLRIKELRKKRGLTGHHLAEMVDVSKGYVSELETGKKTPGSGLLMRLAEALDCSVAELFTGTASETEEASLRVHLDVMVQLSPEDRRAIEKAALGLLSRQPE